MTKREEQTTQWPKEKNRQHNGQKKKNKMKNNDIQNITEKTEDPLENFLYYGISKKSLLSWG